MLNRAFTLFGFSPQLALIHDVRLTNAQAQDFERNRAELRFVRQFLTASGKAPVRGVISCHLVRWNRVRDDSPSTQARRASGRREKRTPSPCGLIAEGSAASRTTGVEALIPRPPWRDGSPRMPQLLELLVIGLPTPAVLFVVLRWAIRREKRAPARQTADRVYYPGRGRNAGLPGPRRRPGPEHEDKRDEFAC